jgi:predicted metal-dependent phosphoesterase TrpH
VHRDEPQLPDAIARIREGGGFASLAHPVRIKGGIDTVLPDLHRCGLNPIEVYHRDHTAAQTIALLDLAQIHGLLVTGVSDYHGAAK